jgi:alkaline phosphatase D
MILLRILAGVGAWALVGLGPVQAAGRMTAGPMLGYATHREVAVWVETEEAQEVSLTYQRVDTAEPEAAVTVRRAAGETTPAGGQPLTFVLGPLAMGASYTYSLAVDGVAVERETALKFRTVAQHEWRGSAPDLSFLLGSCAYFNDAPYDRPGRTYGAADGQIWASLTAAAGTADFMLWLGDNTYLREADFSSAAGIWYRFRADRATPAMQPFLAALPHYATWDDHDFGPNNANRSYPLAGVTRAAFGAYWANQTAGTRTDPAGVYHSFNYADAQFIVLDNRTHRDDSTLEEAATGAGASGGAATKTQYGRAQLDWLKQRLAARNEGGARRHQRLTFIATGGQFLSERFYPGSEDHHRFQAERAEILDFIRANKIGGVVFLSGDVHYAEAMRREGLLPYPLYEFTSSALTAGAHTRDLPADAGRVLAYQKNNFGRVSVVGPPEARVLRYEICDVAGQVVGAHEVAVSELAWPEQKP